MQALCQQTNVVRSIMVKQDTQSGPISNCRWNLILIGNIASDSEKARISSCSNVGHKHLLNIWSTA